MRFLPIVFPSSLFSSMPVDYKSLLVSSLAGIEALRLLEFEFR